MSQNSQKKSSKETSSQGPKVNAALQDSIDIYVAQLKAMGKIADTKQFQVIQSWWNLQLKHVEDQMDAATTPDEVYLLNLNRKVIKKYIKYVKDMLNAIGGPTQ